MSKCGRFVLYRGDCLDVLPRIPKGAVDAVVTDPPYSSGGFTRGDRNADPIEKYQQTGLDIVRESFSGDNRDGRSWCYWCALWISESRRVCKPGGKALVFCDWRQLPLMTDAIQSGGFLWRGLIAWNKGVAARAPHTGYYRHQCEYVVWGSHGPMASDSHGGPWPGCVSHPVIHQDKHHLTGKPTALMCELVESIAPESVILDPFAGSASTGVACVKTGRRFIGIEIDDHYFNVARKRIEQAITDFNGGPMFENVQPQTLYEGGA